MVLDLFLLISKCVQKQKLVFSWQLLMLVPSPKCFSGPFIFLLLGFYSQDFLLVAGFDTGRDCIIADHYQVYTKPRSPAPSCIPWSLNSHCELRSANLLPRFSSNCPDWLSSEDLIAIWVFFSSEATRTLSFLCCLRHCWHHVVLLSGGDWSSLAYGWGLVVNLVFV